MKNKIYRILSLTSVFICAFAVTTKAQKVEYRATQFADVKTLGKVRVSELSDDYMPHLQSLEAPPVSGNAYKQALAERKAEIAILYPKNDNKVSRKRSFVSLPEIVSTFQVRNVARGIPLDNHLAMNDEYIVSAGNFFVSINNKASLQLKKFTLAGFATAIGVTAQPFDPRLAYDEEQDRWILVFLAGFTSSSTHILMAVSETSDPMGDWNTYNITGNPNALNEWTDYPMITMTNEHVYITINLLRNNESWQDGFVETIIWEVEKTGAYAGDNIAFSKYDDITYEGGSVRNVCPAESAADEIYDDVYFVSDRNFAVTNDTFFLIKLDPAADPVDRISIRPILSDVPYGAPPFADQSTGSFATNDARVLEAFRLGDHIQVVGNSRNPENNGAGIFHAVIDDASTATTATLTHIIGDTFDLGYPGLIYTGLSEDEQDAIITFTHSGSNLFAGISAVYYFPEEGYSDILRVVEGLQYVDVQPTSAIERWGDYMGTQRDHSNPGDGWLSATTGGASRDAVPFVAQLRRPLEPTGLTNPTPINLEVSIHPNPVSERMSIDFTIPVGLRSIAVDLFTTSGTLVDRIYQSETLKKGKNNFSFNTDRMAAGSYYVRIVADGKVVLAEQVVKI